MARTRDIHVRPVGTPAPVAPQRDPDAPPPPRILTWHDVEMADEDFREAVKARYMEQQEARAAQFVPPPEPKLRELPPSLTAEEVAAAQRFHEAARAVARTHPAPGLHLTWTQLDELREQDPDGFAAWSRAPRPLHMRSR